MMRYRRFGRTGINMPVFSVGFMRCMHSWQDLAPGEIPIESLLGMAEVAERALTVGCNHFETARGYGTSEVELGRTLQHFARDRYILQTKIEPTADPADFIAHFLDSRKRLGVASVDLLALHGINDHRSLWHACRKGGCLAAARSLVAQGLVRHVGFSSHGETEILLAAIRHEEDGGFDYMNLHWYYISQRHRQAIASAHERDMGVFLISPNDKGGMLYQPPAKLVELCRPLSPMEFNDLFCLSRPEVSTMSIGAARPSDFNAHLQILPLLDDPTGIVKASDCRLRTAMREVTGHDRPDDALWEGLPSWDETPGYINIPFILWLWNLARGWNLLEYSRRRYRHLGRDLAWVPGNNAAVLDKHELTEALSRWGIAPDEILASLCDAHAALSWRNSDPVIV